MTLNVGGTLKRFEPAAVTCNLKDLHWRRHRQAIGFGFGIFLPMNEVCFRISEAIISACAEYKTLFKNRIWSDGIFAPMYFSYALLRPCIRSKRSSWGCPSTDILAALHTDHLQTQLTQSAEEIVGTPNLFGMTAASKSRCVEA